MTNSDSHRDDYFTLREFKGKNSTTVFCKVKVKSSLILKSRYRSNIFGKLGHIFYSKVFYSLTLEVDRFKSLQENKKSKL